VLYLVLVKQLPFPGWRAVPQLFATLSAAQQKAQETAALIKVPCFVGFIEHPDMATVANDEAEAPEPPAAV
jgi:hypothetical protein